MDKLKILSSDSPHFIGSWNISNDKLCENIVSFFETNPNLQKKGVTSGNNVNEDIKKQQISQ